MPPVVMPKTRNRSVREIPLSGREEIFDQVLAIVLRHDPLDINYGNAREEYRPVVRSLLQVLNGCGSKDEACELVQKELTKSLKPYENTADYRSIAVEIWQVLYRRAS